METEKHYEKYGHETFTGFCGKVGSLRLELRKKLKEFMKDKFKYGPLSHDQILSLIGAEFGYEIKQKVKKCLMSEKNVTAIHELQGQKEDDSQEINQNEPKKKGFFSGFFMF